MDFFSSHGRLEFEGRFESSSIVIPDGECGSLRLFSLFFFPDFFRSDFLFAGTVFLAMKQNAR